MNNICPVDGISDKNNNCPVIGYNTICSVDGNSIINNICQVDGNTIMNNICPVNENIDNICLEDGISDICQFDGNASVDSYSRNNSASLEDYDSEEEADNEPMRAVLVPAPRLVGQPFTLTVDQSEQVAAPISLPLTMVANFRSCYNKVKNLKQSLYTLGLDLLVATETWERPQKDLESLLSSPNYRVISYCRGREQPAIRTQGRLAGKEYPGNTGGGAAIFYNKNTFEATDIQIGVPAGVEAVWAVFSSRRMDSEFQRVKRIGVASIYIAPRSPFKKETVTHIIETVHMMRARYNNEIHFILAGDFNRVDVTDVLLRYGALHQVCGVATQQGAALQLVITDLHTFLHPPTAKPPIQVDEGSVGKDGDHQTLILAPRASKNFIVQREKRQITTRPMPEAQINAFCLEVTKYKWKDVMETEDIEAKVENFHNYITSKVDQYFPEKKVFMSNMDKYWTTPELKQLLRRVQRERLDNGKSEVFKSLWSKCRRKKRSTIRNFNENNVKELKNTAPSRWYKMLKKMGGLDVQAGKLEI